MLSFQFELQRVVPVISGMREVFLETDPTKFQIGWQLMMRSLAVDVDKRVVAIVTPADWLSAQETFPLTIAGMLLGELQNSRNMLSTVTGVCCPLKYKTSSHKLNGLLSSMIGKSVSSFRNILLPRTIIIFGQAYRVAASVKI
jgi:hypothetical protein